MKEIVLAGFFESSLDVGHAEGALILYTVIVTIVMGKVGGWIFGLFYARHLRKAPETPEIISPPKPTPIRAHTSIRQRRLRRWARRNRGESYTVRRTVRIED